MITDYFQVDLIKELGLENLSEVEKKELEDKMFSVVEERINSALIARLSEDDKKNLDMVLDNDDELIAFLKEKIPGIELLVAEIISNFKKEMIDLYSLTNEVKEESYGATQL